MQCVVDVVGPLSGLAQPALCQGRYRGGVVEVALGDERQRASKLLRKLLGFGAQLSEERGGRVVAKGVHGVEPQHIHVEIAEPAQRAIREIACARALDSAWSKLTAAPHGV